MSRPFACVYPDAAGVVGPYPDVPSERPHWIAVLLFGAIYVYLYQRTYYPGS